MRRDEFEQLMAWPEHTGMTDDAVQAPDITQILQDIRALFGDERAIRGAAMSIRVSLRKTRQCHLAAYTQERRTVLFNRSDNDSDEPPALTVA